MAGGAVVRWLQLRGAYARAERRFIFTDFGGTLMEKENVDLYIKRSFTQTTGKRWVLPVAIPPRLPSLSDPSNGISYTPRNERELRRLTCSWSVYHLWVVDRCRPSETVMKALQALSENPKVRQHTNRTRGHRNIQCQYDACWLGMRP